MTTIDTDGINGLSVRRQPSGGWLWTTTDAVGRRNPNSSALPPLLRVLPPPWTNTALTCVFADSVSCVGLRSESRAVWLWFLVIWFS